jgi:hypothetical protein
MEIQKAALENLSNEIPRLKHHNSRCTDMQLGALVGQDLKLDRGLCNTTLSSNLLPLLTSCNACQFSHYSTICHIPSTVNLHSVQRCDTTVDDTTTILLL